MATTPKVLGYATLTSSLADIYTCPAATTARVEHIAFANGSTAGTITLKQYFSVGATSKFILNGIAIAANEPIEYAAIILNAGDKIQSSAATTTNCDIIVWGTENA